MAPTSISKLGFAPHRARRQRSRAAPRRLRRRAATCSCRPRACAWPDAARGRPAASCLRALQRTAVDAPGAPLTLLPPLAPLPRAHRDRSTAARGARRRWAHAARANSEEPRRHCRHPDATPFLPPGAPLTPRLPALPRAERAQHGRALRCCERRRAACLALRCAAACLPLVAPAAVARPAQGRCSVPLTVAACWGGNLSCNRRDALAEACSYTHTSFCVALTRPTCHRDRVK